MQLRGFTSGSLRSEKPPTYVWLTALLWLHFTHMGWTKSFIFRSEYSSHNARKTPSHILVSYYSWKLMSLESQFVSCLVGLPWYNDATPPPKKKKQIQAKQTNAQQEIHLLPFCLWCVLYLFQAVWFGEGGLWVNNICKFQWAERDQLAAQMLIFLLCKKTFCAGIFRLNLGFHSLCPWTLQRIHNADAALRRDPCWLIGMTFLIGFKS